MDSIVQAVIKEHLDREAKGMDKYGVNLDRTDLSVIDWLQHAKEEAMDFAVYLEKLKRVGFPSYHSVLEAVRKERCKQDAKWGEQNHEPRGWLAILAEEFGEVSKEVVEWAAVIGDLSTETERLEKMREELVQTAAVCVAFIESLDRNELRG